MKKQYIIITILIFLSSLIYAYEKPYGICPVSLNDKEIKKVENLEDKIIEYEIKSKEIEKFNIKIETLKKQFNEKKDNLEILYKNNSNKLSEEIEKIEKDYDRDYNNIKKDKEKFENDLEKKKSNIDKDKKSLEEEINDRLDRDNQKIKINIDKDILFKISAEDKETEIIRHITTIGSSYVVDDKIEVARDKAIIDAQVKAIEQVLGTFVKAETEASDFTFVKEDISNNVSGYIVSCKNDPNKDVIKDIEGYKLVYVTCESDVNVNQVLNSAENIQGLYKQLGRPKFIVYAKSATNINFNFSPIIESRFINRLNYLGFDCVDPISIDLNRNNLITNLSEYYDTLNENGIQLAFFIDANINIKNGKAADLSKIEMNDCFRVLTDLFNKKTDIECKFNISLLDIKTGKEIYSKDITDKMTKAFVFTSESIYEFTDKALRNYFKSDEGKYIQDLLFNNWSDIVSKRMTKLVINNVDSNDIQTLKDKIEAKNRFFIEYKNENYNNGKLTIEVYNNCRFNTFLNSLKDLSINNKQVEIIAYNPNSEIITLSIN